MLILDAPTPLNGALLGDQLAAAGLVTAVALNGSTVELPGLEETHLAAAQQVVDAHPATAQTALDAVAAELTNETSIRDKAVEALQSNKAFLALNSPTNAQTLAQVKALTRQNNALIRLVLRRFDAAD